MIKCFLQASKSISLLGPTSVFKLSDESTLGMKIYQSHYSRKMTLLALSMPKSPVEPKQAKLMRLSGLILSPYGNLGGGWGKYIFVRERRVVKKKWGHSKPSKRGMERH